MTFTYKFTNIIRKKYLFILTNTLNTKVFVCLAFTAKPLTRY